MTGEEILTGLAEERLREVARTPSDRRESVILNVRPFLTGAFVALARANAFQVRPSLEFLEELLAPIEQPLVDAGVIERVSFSLGAASSATVVSDEDPAL